MGRNGTGVEVKDGGLRLNFTLAGAQVRERLVLNGKTMPATAANLKYAHRLGAEVRAAIASGTFTWAQYFPGSSRALAAAAAGRGPETLGALLDTWLDAKGSLAPATQDQYATGARCWKRLLGSDTRVQDITHKMLAAKIGKHPWASATTFNNYMIVLRGALALEYRGPTVLDNPAAGIENMAKVKRLPDPLKLDERDLMLRDIQTHYDERIYAYFLWQFYTGMRPEETIALRWSDLDMHSQTIRVQRVRTFKGSERDGSKTHGERDVDLLPQALAALTIMRRHTAMQQVQRDGDADTAADIFMNPVTGRAWHDERSQRDHYWKPAMKRQKLRWRTAYNTRHTFATAALMTGAPPAYIASQLGHSVKMLLDRYARWIPGQDQGSARAALAKAMGSNSSRFLPAAGGM